MKITGIEPFLLHVPVTGNHIADSKHQVTHWGAPGVVLCTDSGLAGFGYTGTHAHLATDRLITATIEHTYGPLLMGEEAGDIELNDAVFGVDPRGDVLHRVVTWQLEKARGTARGARERSDVARTGKKFGNQKGGGTARHGNRRSPIFVGGGKAHGPRVRDFNPSLNKKIRDGLKSRTRGP